MYKNKQYPKIPKTIEQLREALESSSVRNDYLRALGSNETEFYIQTVIKPTYSFSVFASLNIINLIRNHIVPKHRNYLIDGTFKIVPKIFYQLLIISIEFMNDVSILQYYNNRIVISSLKKHLYPCN